MYLNIIEYLGVMGNELNLSDGSVRWTILQEIFDIRKSKRRLLLYLNYQPVLFNCYIMWCQILYFLVKFQKTLNGPSDRSTTCINWDFEIETRRVFLIKSSPF